MNVFIGIGMYVYMSYDEIIVEFIKWVNLFFEYVIIVLMDRMFLNYDFWWENVIEIFRMGK